MLCKANIYRFNINPVGIVWLLMASILADTRHWHNVWSMLDHCLRRWPNMIKHWVNVSCLLRCNTMLQSSQLGSPGPDWKVNTFLEGAQRPTHKITSSSTPIHTCAVIACKSESLKRDMVCQIDLMMGHRLQRWPSINPAYGRATSGTAGWVSQ